MVLSNFKSITEFMAKEIARKLNKAGKNIPEEISCVSLCNNKGQKLITCWSNCPYLSYEDAMISLDWISITAEDLLLHCPIKQLETLWMVTKAEYFIYTENGIDWGNPARVLSLSVI